MRNFLERNKLVLIVLAFLLVIGVGGYIFSQSSQPNQSANFAWNTKTQRNITPFGVDSSILRDKYGYYINADSYYPLYTQKSTGCEILGKIDNTQVTAGNEEAASQQLVTEVTGVQKASQRSIRFGQQKIVPVKLSETNVGGKYVAAFGRVFNQEHLQLEVTVTCDSDTKRTKALNEALDSFQMVQASSGY